MLFEDEHLGYRRLRDAADAHPDLDAGAIAELIVGELSDADVRAFARAYVTEQIDGYRRYRAREVEERAELERVHLERREPKPDPEVTEFERIREMPGQTVYVGNRRIRERFRKWMGEDFEAWYEAGRTWVEEHRPEQLEDFEADWHPDGVMAYYRRQHVEQIGQFVTEFASNIRLQVTRELLTTVFALGDGTRVTWGEATVDQHRQRIDLLIANAAANTETAARHEAAIRMIQEVNGRCLADVQTVPLAA